MRGLQCARGRRRVEVERRSIVVYSALGIQRFFMYSRAYLVSFKQFVMITPGTSDVFFPAQQTEQSPTRMTVMTCYSGRERNSFALSCAVRIRTYSNTCPLRGTSHKRPVTGKKCVRVGSWGSRYLVHAHWSTGPLTEITRPGHWPKPD